MTLLKTTQTPVHIKIFQKKSTAKHESSLVLFYFIDCEILN